MPGECADSGVQYVRQREGDRQHEREDRVSYDARRRDVSGEAERQAHHSERSEGERERQEPCTEREPRAGSTLPAEQRMACGDAGRQRGEHTSREEEWRPS